MNYGLQMVGIRSDSVMKLGWSYILIRENLSQGFHESETSQIKWKLWSLGESQILWGYIKSDGSRKLAKIDGNLNSAKYSQLLKDNLIPDLEEGEIFQHDGAPYHRLHATQSFDWLKCYLIESLASSKAWLKYH